jgi:RNA polymerase sigma-70 factor (ECF subfamily)
LALGPRFAQVLLDAQAGDEGAWRALYEELSGPLLTYFRLRGCVDPEDLVGDVFLQLARHMAGFHGDEGAFWGWVFLVARHRLADERRRRRRRPTVPYGDPGSPEMPAAIDVEAEAMARAEVAKLDSLLTGLTPEQREVLVLRVVADLSLDQVAAILGKRTGAVKQLQRRALQNLRRGVEGRGVEGRGVEGRDLADGPGV